MIKHIGSFKCRILRDAMQVASQFSNSARMKIDALGIHIKAWNIHNTAVVWIDIPATTFNVQYDSIDEFITSKGDINIHCEKLYRMLNAYEGNQEVWFSLESRLGEGEFAVTSGPEGRLRAYQTSLDHITKTPSMTFIRTAKPLHANCDIGADGFREWLKHVQVVTNQVSFRHARLSGKFPIRAFSVFSPESVVMSHPDVDPDAPEEFESLYTLELLQNMIAPECIDGDIRFSFGDQTILFMGIQLHGCDITMALAPRIEV